MPEHFGTMPDGTEVRRHTIRNDHLCVRILEIGAAIQSIEAPDRTGNQANVVLGMETLDDYRLRSPHFGAVPGRTAGRIAKGRFTLDGVPYQLECNAGGNSLHGGPDGFGRRAWSATDSGPTHLELRLVSPDGDAGYPGEVTVHLRYGLEGPALHLDFTATTTRPTLLNLTNHSYFNLAGEGSGSVVDHRLTLHADRFLPIDGNSIPTGEQRSVDGTPFDFRSAHRIGDRIRQADPQMLAAMGYDQCYLLRGQGYRHAATLEDPGSGRCLLLSTTEPALQLYTGNSLNGTLSGLSGRSYRQTDAVCLEAQHPPDSINHPGFPQSVLRQGDTYRARTTFRFETDAPPADRSSAGRHGLAEAPACGSNAPE